MPIADLAACRVSYREDGTGDTVLLLGPLGATAGVWKHQLASLTAHHRVVIPDVAEAEPTAGHDRARSTAEAADVLAELLRVLGVERAHVVGASVGGCVGQQLALRHPGLVRTLALHGTWAKADRHLSALLRSLERVAQTMPMLDVCRQLWPLVYTVWWHNDRPEAQETLERELAVHPPDAEAFMRQLHAGVEHDVLDRLPEIDVPTLLTVGDRDMLTPAHHTYAMKDQMPQARVRLWHQMGHAPYEETAAEFNRVTLEHFAAAR
jgi:pimeloyl-ACP methyl ester carboxylesterase